MTAQEQQMLQGLVDRVNQAQLQEKDAEAEQMLAQTLGKNPDALYILAQTVLVQGYALEQAQKQLADARTQMDQMRQQAGTQQQTGTQPARHGSFLGNLLGLNQDEPSRSAAPPQPQPQYAPVAQYPTQPQYPPQPQYAPGYGGGYAPGFGAPQQGGFLRSAMQTATGVAAGALAFEGIESLMHGFGHAAGYGSDFGGGFGGGRPEEVINNYYGDSGREGDRSASGGGLADASSSLSPDIEDRRGESRFSDAVSSGDHGDVSAADSGSDAGTGTDDAQDFADSASGDDSSYDDASSGGDDSGSDFDSGGGDDQGGGDSGF